jgi:hypothetical protein
MILPMPDEPSRDEQAPAPARPRATDVHLSEGKSMTFPPVNSAVAITVGGMPSPPATPTAPVVVVQTAPSDGASPAAAPPPEATASPAAAPPPEATPPPSE